jgi:hypothetical protein
VYFSFSSALFFAFTVISNGADNWCTKNEKSIYKRPIMRYYIGRPREGRAMVINANGRRVAEYVRKDKTTRVAIASRRHEELIAELVRRGVKEENLAKLLSGDCTLSDGTSKAERIIGIAFIMCDKYKKHDIDTYVHIAAATYYKVAKRERENGRRVNALGVIETIEDQLAGRRQLKINADLARTHYGIASVLADMARAREVESFDFVDHIAARDAAVKAIGKVRAAMGHRLTATLDGIFALAAIKYTNCQEFIDDTNCTMLFKNIRRKFGERYLPGFSYSELVHLFFNNWDDVRKEAKEKELKQFIA